MKFFKEVSEFEPENKQERLICLSENLEGNARRKPKNDPVDPFTNELETKLNVKIASAEQMLKKAGLTVDFSSYKRKLQ